jgi:hypothetical protein
LKKWDIVIAEESVRAYKLDNGSYLTDFEKDNFVYIFKKINSKTIVTQVKKNEYSKYFKRKTFIPMVVLQVELIEKSYVSEYYFVLAETTNSYDKELEKINKQLENRTIEKNKKDNLFFEINNNKKKLLEKFQSLDIETLEKIELEKFNLFLINTIEKIDNKNFNQEINNYTQIDKTIEGIKKKKEKKILQLKNHIDLILLNESKINITQLCKELKINRKTFYNLELNQYFEQKYK